MIFKAWQPTVATVFTSSTETNHQVAKFSSTGAYIQDVGSWGGGDNQLRYPTDITIDGSDTILLWT